MGEGVRGRVGERIRSHRELEVYQLAFSAAMEIFELTKGFPREEVYSLTDQMRRAVVSIPGNIAEGRSRQHVKEFLQHLSIAYGSLAEVETYLQISVRLNYLREPTAEALMEKTSEIGRMINGLRKSLTKK